MKRIDLIHAVITQPTPRFRQASHSIRLAALAIAIAGFISGCASPGGGSSSASGMSREAVLNHSDVKGKKPTTFAKPIASVHEAALRALTGVGGRLEKDEPYFVSGSRPHKMGLFVGSGGETVKIFMLPETDKSTNVWVDTDLSFVGMAGQQGWNTQVLEEMSKLLK